VAKILVADDNSNIQKMVGLALKDQGIDVVAVGNGEAAVRKIADVKPDLVLADVFMPVRNGYEVCKFVKEDSALAHIPVILLVGAFDPLDEQEAQRVGADGVLKKPFVPADPLISMVKSALTRAGVLHGEGGPAKTPEPEPLRVTDMLTPRGGAPVHEVTAQPILANDSESFVDEVPARPTPIRIDSGPQPVAFGSLLETPSPSNETEDDAAFIPPNPELEAERSWQDSDEEEEIGEEEEKPQTAWRLDESEPAANTGSHSKDPGWRKGGFEQINAKRSQYEAWEAEQEKPSEREAAQAPQEIRAGMKEVPPSAPVIPKATPPAPVKPFSSDAWAPAKTTSSREQFPAKTTTAVEEVPRVPSPEVVPVPEVTKQPETNQKPAGESWYSASSSPWDAEIEKANRLASAWDAPVSAPTTPPSSNGTEKVATGTTETSKEFIEEAALPSATVEVIREEAAQIAEEAVQSVVPPEAAVHTGAGSQQRAPELPTPSTDDLVAKVLAKMSPDVLQAVTREILRPVVEAMVKEEMKPKK